MNRSINLGSFNSLGSMLADQYMEANAEHFKKRAKHFIDNGGVEAFATELKSTFVSEQFPAALTAFEEFVLDHIEGKDEIDFTELATIWIDWVEPTVMAEEHYQEDRQGEGDEDAA